MPFRSKVALAGVVDPPLCLYALPALPTASLLGTANASLVAVSPKRDISQIGFAADYVPLTLFFFFAISLPAPLRPAKGRISSDGADAMEEETPHR